MIKVGIVGGTGYTGVELLRLLAGHPKIQLQAITSRKEDGLQIAAMFPNLRGHIDLAFSSLDKTDLRTCDVVFFATPHGVAMAQAPELLAAGVKIIDLAADFRFKDPAIFEQWYGMPHSCPAILAQAVYGLPELNRTALKHAKVVGNPGCYPTTVQLGLLPLLENRPLIDTQTIIADCKSGVSGAGRKAETPYLFTEAGDNFKAYGVKGHRHHPEIVQQLQTIAKQPIRLTFVPHLVPMIRGMFSTLYVKILPAAQDTDFQALFEQRYANEPFVDVLPVDMLPDTRSVRASNMLRIALHRNDHQLIILVVQDNLTKGAAGQAVQTMNAMFGLPETTGLLGVPVLP